MKTKSTTAKNKNAGKRGDKETKPPKEKKKPVPAEVSSARKYAAWQLRVFNPRMTFREITEKINEMFPDYPLESDHQAVEWMVKEAQKEYIDEHKSKVDEVKAEVGVTLDWVRKEAADAWEKSKDLLRTIKKRDDETIEQILKADTGNAQYLRRITEAITEKAKVFGAHAPKRHEITGKDGAPLAPQFDLKVLAKYLSDEDLDKIGEAATILERAQHDHDLDREVAAQATN